MPFNSAGKSDPNNLFIPRACLSIALLDSNDKPTSGWRELGEVSDVSVQFGFSEAEKFSSCGEQRARIARVAIEQTADLTMTLDEVLDYKNLELIFSGAADTRVQAGGSVAPQLFTYDLSDQVGISDGVLVVPNPYYNGTDAHVDPVPWGRAYQIWTGVIASTEHVFAGPAPSGQTFGSGPAVAIPAYLPTQNVYNVEIDKISIEDTLDGSTGVSTAALLTGYTVSALYGTIFIEDVGGATALKTRISSLGIAAPTLKWIRFPLAMADRVAAVAPIPRMRALTTTSRLVTLQLRQQNSARPGWRQLTHIFKTRLISDGDFSFVSDGTDFAGTSLSGSLERASWAAATRGLEGWMTSEELAAGG